MAFVQAQVDADDIADAMNEDGSFLWHMLRVISERTHAGLLRDNAGDIAMSLAKDQAEFVSAMLADLGRAVKDGYNLANHDIIK